MTSERRGTLIVIAGPTGSGKTDISIGLAQKFGAPIISTDSRQVFHGMAIGTAQPTKKQLAAVKHYFIDDRDVSDDYNAGRFEAEALKLLEGLFKSNDFVIAVGGSGLYIDALCNGFDPFPRPDPELRSRLERRLNQDGLDALVGELLTLDPDYYRVVDRSNPLRVLRAVEVCIQTGKPYSSHLTGKIKKRPFGIVKAGIDIPRDELYERIESRVDAMVADGLEEEARRLYPLRSLNALMTVGYREFFDYFDGKSTREEAIAMIKRNSRRYAKRQMTWFRKDKEIVWFGKNEINSIEKFCGKFAE